MSKTKQHRAFTGGGTGGHVQPIVSLLEYAEEKNFAQQGEFFWFGEKDSQESKAAKNIDRVRFVSVLAGKFRRYRTVSSILCNIRDIFLVIGGFCQSLYWLKKYKITALFCKGGYVAFPVSFAAKVLGIQIIMHESDTHAGLVNRLVATFAHQIFTGFPQVFPNAKVVGQILSGQLGQRKKASLRQNMNIDQEKTTVLVMGGSQGAARIFDVLLDLLAGGMYHKMNFLILLGTKNESYKVRFDMYEHVQSFGFLGQKDIAYLYALSDIAITRGSGTSLAEQQLFGVKKLIVPLPFTGGNHQFYNALRYSEAYDDIIVEQDKQLTENIQVFLDKLQGYKKKRDHVDEQALVAAKEIIWEYLL